MLLKTTDICQSNLETELSYAVNNTIAADDLMTNGVRASAAMILIWLARIIQAVHNWLRVNFMATG